MRRKRQEMGLKIYARYMSQYELIPIWFFPFWAEQLQIQQNIFATLKLFSVICWKWGSTHALGGVSGVASFISTDEQPQ